MAKKDRERGYERRWTEDENFVRREKKHVDQTFPLHPNGKPYEREQDRAWKHGNVKEE